MNDTRDLVRVHLRLQNAIWVGAEEADFERRRPREVFAIRNAQVRIAIHAPRAKPMKEPSPKRGRQRGSARFRTYYKVQVFNDRTACWDDIQRAYGTAEAARAAYPPGRRCRVMEVTPQGRQPLA